MEGCDLSVQCRLELVTWQWILRDCWVRILQSDDSKEIERLMGMHSRGKKMQQDILFRQAHVLTEKFRGGQGRVQKSTITEVTNPQRGFEYG